MSDLGVQKIFLLPALKMFKTLGKYFIVATNIVAIVTKIISCCAPGHLNREVPLKLKQSNIFHKNILLIICVMTTGILQLMHSTLEI